MNELKQTIAAKTRTLKAKWTIAPVIDTIHHIDKDVWDEIGKSLQEEIDQEIVDDIRRQGLMLEGWHKAPFTSEKFTTPVGTQIADVVAWIHLNATAQYQIFGREFWFTSEEDLTLFVLKWS
jgi:hypothetical protein